MSLELDSSAFLLVGVAYSYFHQKRESLKSSNVVLEVAAEFKHWHVKSENFVRQVFYPRPVASGGCGCNV